MKEPSAAPGLSIRAVLDLDSGGRLPCCNRLGWFALTFVHWRDSTRSRTMLQAEAVAPAWPLVLTFGAGGTEGHGFNASRRELRRIQRRR